MDLSMTVAEIEFETLVENVRDALYTYDLWLEEASMDDGKIIQVDPSTVQILHS